MKVKIIKSDKWYKNRVGEIIEVCECADNEYGVLKASFPIATCWINRDHCKIFSESTNFKTR